MAEQTQMNNKESTKEGKIKVLIWLTNDFENKRSFREMTKQDILDYLNNLRSPVSEDPTHKWIGSYNDLGARTDTDDGDRRSDVLQDV
jgi:hypothetical protein